MRSKNSLNIRLKIFVAVILSLFISVAARLYYIQIVKGEEYMNNAAATVIRTVEYPAARGNIYDKYGRALAENKVKYDLKIDLSVKGSGNIDDIVKLIKAMGDYGVVINNNFPITNLSGNYTFDFSGAEGEKRWKTDMGFKNEQMDFDANETVEYLSDFFEIPTGLSEEEFMDTLFIMNEIHMQRYKKYNAVTIAENISKSFISYVEENNELFPGVFVESGWYRYYPYGECMAHIVGYVGNINDEELKEYEEYGYTQDDKVGKSGIEKTYELTLNGDDGVKAIEVDSHGRRVKEVMFKEPVKGGDIYLTIDAELQKKIYEYMRENLKSVLFMNIDSGKVSFKDVINSMLDNNIISFSALMVSNEGKQKEIRDTLLNYIDGDDTEKLKETFIDLFNRNIIDAGDTMIILYEQNFISLNDEELIGLRNGSAAVYEILKDKIISNEIPINRINMDPCTGSAVVEDINTGNVLAMVSFPSYDTNRLTNTFDSEYYNYILSDKTSPLINRATMERKAPGSIFKMISAIAGLEEGVVDANTIIQDKGIFKDAGTPYAKCLIYSNYGTTHGAVDVVKALEVSCNYYFYTLAYNMGNMEKGTELETARIFEEYAAKFGLNDYSGVEISEYKPQVASPEVKKESVEAYNPEADEYQKKWTDGDNIRNAIGQSYNNYSTVNIAKYISALANEETLYKSTLVEKTVKYGNEEFNYPVQQGRLEFDGDNLSAVKEGMYMVTHGSRGSLRNYFRDFPVEVAAKTGTAEEDKRRPSHSWFAGFAPYNNPQIAVAVMVPFGEGSGAPAINTAKDIILEYMGFNYKADKGNMFNTELAVD